jgi:uncharacterized membrane protein
VTSNRLEAFSDAVIAIVMTIMVLELRAPHGDNFDALRPLAGVFLSYLLSFVYLGIYWNNHHHLFQATKHVTGGVLWANLHLLFWLSLFPFTTAWMGENHVAHLPTAMYGLNQLLAAIAYFVLQTTIIANEGPRSTLATAIGNNVKGKVSPAIYAAAIPIAFVAPWVSLAFYVSVALIWFIPDPRVEAKLADK